MQGRIAGLGDDEPLAVVTKLEKKAKSARRHRAQEGPRQERIEG